MRTRGFTLLELLLVLAIIALAVGVLIPRLPDVAGVELRQSARRLAGAARYAADQAAVRKTTFRLAFDFKQRAYRIEFLDRENVWRPDPTTLGRPVRLPGDIRLAAVETRGGRQTEGDVFVEFYPKGYAERALVQVSRADNDAYTVEIRPFDPKPRVHAGLLELREADARAFVPGSR
jgi:type II secretion system protein H